MNKNQTTYKEILKYLGEHEVIGNKEDIVFKSIANITSKNTDSICFIDKNRKYKKDLINNSSANLILIDNKKIEGIFPGKILIKVDDPKLVFSKIGNALFVTKKPKGFIHPSAIIDEEAKIHESCFIGPNCTIGKVNIGSDCYLHSNIVLYDNTVLNSNVIINSGTVIGSEGYGYNADIDNIQVQFPHIGCVVIESNVEIGTNVCIDRGALSNTIIGFGTKIDNLVHIAHNVIIGKNCCIVANVVICGSTIIGDNSYIAPSSCVRDAIQLGSDCLVGLSSTVMKSMPNNSTWVGSPALPLKEFVSQNKTLKRLRNNKD